MNTGIYETLLTTHLNRELEMRDDLRPEFGTVDDAEQALALARHLSPLIERSLRAAGGAGQRVDLARRNSVC
ncbi:hypothetical protein [Mycolicibacterium celeriflavum]|uniref:hypothetical protein n=1 Tax=Mycolicibacterium celeriflavum TaxID=1249101 RepID=UPI0010426B6A|nr:hypothetical protein [Mycolicibacterium celeriflavum]